MLGSDGAVTSKTRISFNQEAVKTEQQAEFKYGWCKTDHKNGTYLGHADYLNDKIYAPFVKKILAEFGLPIPKDEEIFRGTEHDMLFLDSHGVVVRIGPANIPDLMNPAIVQPLGWKTDKGLTIEIGPRKAPLTVAIYPGIELYKDFNENGAEPDTKLYDFLAATGQGTNDLHELNKGIIRVLGDDGKEVAVDMLLGADNWRNNSSDETSSKRTKVMSNAKEGTDNFGEAISKTIVNIFNAAKDAQWYQKAFEAHEPLRRLFWEGYKGKSEGEKPDAECMKHFWNTCARVTNNPGACVMPVWKAVEKGGKTDFVREEVYMPHVVLYRPWTGRAADKIIQPINQSKEVAEAVRLAHEKEIEQALPRTSLVGAGRRQSGLLACFGQFFKRGG